MAFPVGAMRLACGRVATAWSSGSRQDPCMSLTQRGARFTPGGGGRSPMRAPGGFMARRRDARQLRPVMAALFSADAKDRDEKAYQAAPGEAKVLFKGTSVFGNGLVRVLEWAPWRVLVFNEVEQGLTYMDVGRTRKGAATALPEVLGFDYLRAMASAGLAYCRLQGCDLQEANASCVFVGLGSGALPAFVHHHLPSLPMTVVEIDPLVAFVTTEYFGFPTRIASVAELCTQDSRHVAAAQKAAAAREGTVDVVLNDAESFMAVRPPASTSCIFLDAYDGGGQIPAHLKRPEFLEACVAALAPGGVLVVNLFNGAEGTKARAAVVGFARLLERLVGTVSSIKCVEQQTNVILVACTARGEHKRGEDRHSRAQVVYAAKEIGKQQGMEFNPAKYVSALYWVETDGGTGFREVNPGNPLGWPRVSSAVEYRFEDA